MSVVALVCNESQADLVVTWAARFAMARNTDLVIYYLTSLSDFRRPKVSIDGQERYANPLREAIQQTIEKVVRTRQARKGRIGRHDVSVRHITDGDPVTTVIKRIRVETPVLFVGAGESNPETDQLQVSRQVAYRVSCDSVILYGVQDSSTETGKITVGSIGGTGDTGALQLAVAAAETVSGVVTAISLDSKNADATDSTKAKDALSKNLGELMLEPSESLLIKSISSDEPIKALAERSKKQDLVLMGVDSEKAIAKLPQSNQKTTVGIFRPMPRYSAEQGWVRAMSLLPRINPADYADLYERLQFGSRWNADFIVMLGLATAIATLGLLQSSPAVVIGSMLLAPLMTPMIGMGLALNRGNAKLAYASFRAIGRGFLAALLISGIIGYITPGTELTPEIFARTDPNILDLLIATFSGMAAAYAMARPGLAGSIAGVAIATALVPPLCATGISISYGHFPEAIGAAWLLAANVLAIILSAAVTFRAMGLSDFSAISPQSLWVKRVVIGLTICCIVVATPLVGTFFHQIKQGKSAPIALVVTNETRQAIINKIDQDSGVSLLLIGRPGMPREFDPVDVGVIILSEQRLPKSYADEIIKIVRDTMADQDLVVRVECVADGWQ